VARAFLQQRVVLFPSMHWHWGEQHDIR